MYGKVDRAQIEARDWAVMPRPNQHLTALARDVVRCAAPLLPRGAGLFLGAEIDTNGMLRLLWWRADDFGLVAEIGTTPEGFCPIETPEGALQEACAELLEYLAARWATPPAGYGVITDGTGVAFAPDHPAPSAPGWLVRHATGSEPLVAIVPLDPAGPCALLAHRQARQSLH